MRWILATLMAWALVLPRAEAEDFSKPAPAENSLLLPDLLGQKNSADAPEPKFTFRLVTTPTPPKNSRAEPGSSASAGTESSKPGTPASTKTSATPDSNRSGKAPQSLAPGERIFLEVEVNIPAGSYIQALGPTPPTASRIRVMSMKGLEPVGQFQADPPPVVETDKFTKLSLKKHYDRVLWRQEFLLTQQLQSEGAQVIQPSDIRVAGSVRYSLCDKSTCRPPATIPFDFSYATSPLIPATEGTGAKAGTVNTSAEKSDTEADLLSLVEEKNAPKQAALKTDRESGAGAVSAKTNSAPNPDQVPSANMPGGGVQKTVPGSVPASKKTDFEVVPTRRGGGGEREDPLKIRFRLEPADAKVGEEVKVSITVTFSDPEWHTFSLTQNPDNAGLPTVIQVRSLKNLEPTGAGWSPDVPPHVEIIPELKNIEQRTHEGTVTWSRTFKVTRQANTAGDYGVVGSVRYQICRKGQCLAPKAVPFELGETTGVLEATAASNAIGPEPKTTKIVQPLDWGNLAKYLFFAFLGGMILNVMPCVLPVIAIKVLSFVQQAGESRSRILALNLVYSAGVISVFVVLATLAVTLSYGWGGLFQKAEFNLVMACVMFAMGLSLLGVFEIPVPGLVGSAAGGDHQEGLPGAFLTGVFATLLATPCSGPFLGVTLAWSVQQSTLVTYLVWIMMGVGMAFPYIIFGMNPALIRLLPKPGNWMVRFKEFAGFVLMGSVIFMVSFIDRSLTIAVLVMLLGVALGLWMIGNLYDVNSRIRHKNLVRVTAFVLTAGICFFGYSLGGGLRLPWRPFSEEVVRESLAKKQTVLIDFTADWCLTCKTNEFWALNTRETLSLVKEHNIVPLHADYTHNSPEIERWLTKFDSISVPLTVIIPADRPNEPIILRDLYTKQELLKQLKVAVGTAEGKALPQGDTPQTASVRTAEAAP